MAVKKAVKAIKKPANKQIKVLGKPINGIPFAALIAEFIGTFLLVSAIFVVQGQALFAAFALIGVVLIVGGISGAHVNPAVTVGVWVTRRIGAVRALGYIGAQVLGAGAAYLTLKAFLGGIDPASAQFTFGAAPELFHVATLSEDHRWYVLFAELLGVTALAFGAAAAFRRSREHITRAFGYGLALFIGLLIAGSATGMFLTESNTTLSFLNPAVAFAGGGITWDVWPLAIYLFIPVLGGAIGFSLQDFLQRNIR